MARLFNDGSSQYLVRTEAVLTGPPLSVGGWFNSDDDTINQAIFTIAASADALPFVQLEVSGLRDGDPVRLIVRDAASNLQAAETSTGWTANAWYHALGVWASATSTAAYIDGGSVGTDSTPTLGALTGVNRTAIGARVSTGVSTEFSGMMAEIGLWNAALTAAEGLILATGISPLAVRPQSLVAYWQVLGNLSPELDFVGRYGLTLTNGPTKADHPPVRYLVTPQLIYAPVAAAAAVGPFPTFLPS